MCHAQGPRNENRRGDKAALVQPAEGLGHNQGRAARGPGARRHPAQHRIQIEPLDL